jgi:type IV pilus assembly protein PilQ
MSQGFLNRSEQAVMATSNSNFKLKELAKRRASMRAKLGAGTMKNRMLQLVVAVVATALFVSEGVDASATASLKNVSFASLPGGRFEVRMDFDSAPPEPAGYEIDKPARVVFDFAGVHNTLTTKKYSLPFENAQSAVILGGEDKTRLVLNMNTLDRYQTHIDGNSFFIDMGSSNVVDPLTKKSSLGDKLSSEVNSFKTGITNVDFQRGENGEGKILVTLSNPAANINVEQSSGEIKLNFIDTQLPVNLRRKLDVTDFATPVLSVSSDFDGKDTVISVKPQGDYDYLAYQADNLYVVSVKRLTAKEQEERKSKFNYVGEKLSLNFQDIPVRSVLQIIADFTELNLVASDTVTGTITLRLDNVPWDQALDLVLKTKGLDKRQIGNVLMVAPAAEIAEQERKQLETQKQLAELAPLHTEHIQILYAEAKKLFILFNSSAGANSIANGSDNSQNNKKSILSERGSAFVDERTNSIIVNDTDEKIEQIKSLIKVLDVPVRQVSIESRLVRANTSYAKSLGVRWGVDAGQGAGAFGPVDHGVGYRLDGGVSNSIGSYVGSSVSQWSSTGQVAPGVANAVDLGASQASSQFTVGILDAVTGSYVALELSAMESSGNGEIVSQPRVITQDKTEASIKEGTQIPYTTVSSTGTNVIFKDAVLGLLVTPSITPNDHIMMKIKVNKDSQGTDTVAGPVINVSEIVTNVMVNNGETAVIGGIYEETKTNELDKVPFFGDLPLIGSLFRRTSTDDEKTELLIFLTPRIVNDPLARN